jgi:hypothetical protein
MDNKLQPLRSDQRQSILHGMGHCPGATPCYPRERSSTPLPVFTPPYRTEQSQHAHACTHVGILTAEAEGPSARALSWQGASS